MALSSDASARETELQPHRDAAVGPSIQQTLPVQTTEPKRKKPVSAGLALERGDSQNTQEVFEHPLVRSAQDIGLIAVRTTEGDHDP